MTQVSLSAIDHLLVRWSPSVGIAPAKSADLGGGASMWTVLSLVSVRLKCS